MGDDAVHPLERDAVVTRPAESGGGVAALDPGRPGREVHDEVGVAVEIRVPDVSVEDEIKRLDHELKTVQRNTEQIYETLALLVSSATDDPKKFISDFVSVRKNR